jgi:hypothetical protein
MTTPATGALKFSDINTELGLGSTTQNSMSAALTRTLAGVASGAIRFSDLRGKSSVFSFNIGAGNNINLRSAAIAAGWNQVSAVIANVLAGITIGSASTGAYALTIDGSFPNGVRLNNAGVIIGRGGDGGAGGNVSYTLVGPLFYKPGSPGGAGGPAILASVSVSINNTGVIYGGGGGGGGSGGCNRPSLSGIGYAYVSGGGGGGGRGGSAGGLAGTGSNILPGGFAGTAGTVSSAGTGGACTYTRLSSTVNFVGGGNGGDAGATGTTPGASLDVQNAGGAGGAAGVYLAGNTNVTWVATGTRAGSVS